MTTHDYELSYKTKLANKMKEKQMQDLTDISIQILDMLVEYGFVHDCFNTDDSTEFFVQDKINEILTRNLLKEQKQPTIKNLNTSRIN